MFLPKLKLSKQFDADDVSGFVIKFIKSDNLASQFLNESNRDAYSKCPSGKFMRDNNIC